MASEKQMWTDDVAPVMKAFRLDPIRIENSVRLGTPDVNYIHGWIELKTKAAWPVRETTPLRIEHFSPQQRVWLRRRWLSGGHAWLLLRVGREFLLFDGVHAALHVGNVLRHDLYQIATARSANGFDPNIFIPVLTTARK